MEAGSIGDSIILANGDVNVASAVGDSLIISDGEVIVGSGVGNSLIVARRGVTINGYSRDSVVGSHGAITLPNGFVKGSRLYAGGDITIKLSVERSRLISAAKIFADAGSSESSLQEDQTRISYPAVLFSLSGFGISVSERKAEVYFASVSTESALFKSGIRAGDRVVAVDDARISSLAGLRRSLRKAVALGEGVVLVYARSGEQLQAALKLDVSP